MQEVKTELRFYDAHSLRWLGLVNRLEYLTFTRDLYGVGSFEMQLYCSEINMELCKKDNFFVINGDIKKNGIIKYIDIEDDLITVSGHTGDVLLKKRIIVPPADGSNYGYSVCEGMAETVIKHFVSSNMKDTYNTARDIENFEVAEDTNFGVTDIAWRARYSQLNEELEDLCEYVKIGYNILPDLENKKWIFDIIRGKELISYPMFKTEYNNIKAYHYIEDYTEYANTLYAGGDGEDEDQLIYIINDSEYSGFEREEVYADCSSAENITELIMYGENELEEYKEKKTLEITAQNKTFIFDEDYYLGDTVRVYIDRLGFVLDLIVSSITETWTRKNGYSFELVLGDEEPNIFNVKGE